MQLHVRIIELDPQGHPTVDSPRVLVLDGGLLRGGSAPDSEILLPGTASACFVIHRKPRGVYELHPGASTQPTIGDDGVSGPILLRNESEVVVDNYSLRFSVVFEAVGQPKGRGLLSSVAFVAVLMAFLFELSMLSWLPIQVKKQKLLGVDVARQRTLALLDELREEIGDLPKDQLLNPRATATIQLIGTEADHIAYFLRGNEERLSIAEINLLAQDLTGFLRTVKRIKAGGFFPPPPEIQLEGPLSTLLAPVRDEQQ